MSDTLTYRTRDACAQLTRYGGGVASEELADVLDTLTDLNDDMHHGRADSLVQEQVEKMKAQLDRVLATYRVAY